MKLPYWLNSRERLLDISLSVSNNCFDNNINIMLCIALPPCPPLDQYQILRPVSAHTNPNIYDMRKWNICNWIMVVVTALLQHPRCAAWAVTRQEDPGLTCHQPPHVSCCSGDWIKIYIFLQNLWEMIPIKNYIVKLKSYIDWVLKNRE